MKQQYFGDVNDYRKYGLLRCLSAAGVRVGVVWMMTPNDTRPDGRRTRYLADPARWRNYDPSLFDGLARFVREQRRRDTSCIERSGLLWASAFGRGEVSSDQASRHAYFDAVRHDLGKTDILFLDPDNGPDVPSVPPGRRESPRHVYCEELHKLWASGASLVVYRRYPREARPAFIARRTYEMSIRLPGSDSAAIWTSHALFLIALRGRHLRRWERARGLVRGRWHGQLEPVRSGRAAHSGTTTA